MFIALLLMFEGILNHLFGLRAQLYKLIFIITITYWTRAG